MALIIDSGSVTIMKMTTPPTGWTKNVTDNDYALRVVTGSTVDNLAGTEFSTVFSDYTVTASSTTLTIGATTINSTTIPTHRHNRVNSTATVTRTNAPSGTAVAGQPNTFTSDNTGGGGSHTHPNSTNLFSSTVGSVDFRIRYRDVISVTRN